MDALDTLYIMEMFEEFDAATDWVEKNLNFNVVSLSETYDYWPVYRDYNLYSEKQFFSNYKYKMLQDSLSPSISLSLYLIVLSETQI